jgi:hypothetical protein
MLETVACIFWKRLRTFWSERGREVREIPDFATWFPGRTAADGDYVL